MYVHAQVSQTYLERDMGGAAVVLSVPPSPTTQFANVRIGLKQQDFDTLDPQVGDEFDLLFEMVPANIDLSVNPGVFVSVKSVEKGTSNSMVMYETMVMAPYKPSSTFNYAKISLGLANDAAADIEVGQCYRVYFRSTARRLRLPAPENIQYLLVEGDPLPEQK